jgi:hypothetical protein
MLASDAQQGRRGSARPSSMSLNAVPMSRAAEARNKPSPTAWHRSIINKTGSVWWRIGRMGSIRTLISVTAQVGTHAGLPRSNSRLRIREIEVGAGVSGQAMVPALCSATRPARHNGGILPNSSAQLLVGIASIRRRQTMRTAPIVDGPLSPICNGASRSNIPRSTPHSFSDRWRPVDVHLDRMEEFGDGTSFGLVASSPPTIRASPSRLCTTCRTAARSEGV